MKIVVAVRTRDEQRNMARFCLGHRWADKILVADGGSEDDTVSIASAFRNVEVRAFTERVNGENNRWRNPHGKHINFLINWAKEENADWMIFDDCDCFPTRDLRLNVRSIIENSDAGGVRSIFLHRLYIYLGIRYFPQLNKPGQSIWAWRVDSGLYADETNPWAHMLRDVPAEQLMLDEPYCCLHDYCPDEETIDRKLKFYQESGEIPLCVHPLHMGGALLPLPDWAKE